MGTAAGLHGALYGAYKDSPHVEGSSWRKFAKSPAFGALGGLIASGHTMNDLFLLLATIGSMRMFLELLFKMIVRDYAPARIHPGAMAHASGYETDDR